MVLIYTTHTQKRKASVYKRVAHTVLSNNLTLQTGDSLLAHVNPVEGFELIHSRELSQDYIYKINLSGYISLYT